MGFGTSRRKWTTSKTLTSTQCYSPSKRVLGFFHVFPFVGIYVEGEMHIFHITDGWKKLINVDWGQHQPTFVRTLGDDITCINPYQTIIMKDGLGIKSHAMPNQPSFEQTKFEYVTYIRSLNHMYLYLNGKLWLLDLTGSSGQTNPKFISPRDLSIRALTSAQRMVYVLQEDGSILELSSQLDNLRTFYPKHPIIPYTFKSDNESVYWVRNRQTGSVIHQLELEGEPQIIDFKTNNYKIENFWIWGNFLLTKRFQPTKRGVQYYLYRMSD